MFGSIIAALGGQFFDSLFGKVADTFKAYFEKQITEAQLKAEVVKAMGEAAKEIEVSHSETLAKTYESFQQTLRTSPELRRMFSIVVYSQLFVLFWSQWIVPAVHWMGYGGEWRAGTTADWAYLLVGGLCGAAPMLLRSGPGAWSVTDKFKNLIGR